MAPPASSFPVPASVPLQPGFLVLQGNRLEMLWEAVSGFIAGHPLGPLEPEVFLVQSNGVGEWLKMQLAQSQGICAAARVELPGRFLWQAYRRVLAQDAVAPLAPLDAPPLVWRLMRLLPQVAAEPGFEPVASFLAAGHEPAQRLARRLQLAQRLAALFEQYQIHRGDWLLAWSEGREVLTPGFLGAARAEQPLPASQRWQALLWQRLLAELPAPAQAQVRPRLHQAFLQALARAAAAPHGPGGAPAWNRPPGLPRRVVLFAACQLPYAVLQGLHALSSVTQVLLAVPNPSRFHWGDLIEGREWLRQVRRRHPHRAADLATVPLQDMHLHGPPLLAAWGRQGRDFLHLLSQFEEAEREAGRLMAERVDHFDAEPATTLLQALQRDIRELEPDPRTPDAEAWRADRSIVFHVCHSAQREVEVLHDQLLALLAHPPRPGLQPRDIVVMVPEIGRFAPAIRAVFGQYGRGDRRFIPFDIVDLQERGQNPLLLALEWLLRLPAQRCGASELVDLLEVPAIARAAAVAAADLPRIKRWVVDAGIRWGLDAAHRESLGLEACGEVNTWRFGLDRLVLGHAVGDATEPFAGTQPFAGLGAGDSELAGRVVAFVERVEAWWRTCSAPAAPAVWAGRVRALVRDLFLAGDDRERLLLERVERALVQWLEQCEVAGFDEPLDWRVAHETWLASIDEPGLGRPFKGAGVTFCNLKPLRTLPFEVVCLLGMNEGEFPRQGQPMDFDLMSLAGHARPGDQSRREDDRQLMLESLLSARQVLYVSWAGRDIRDNSERPPSVLVSQLRDAVMARVGAQGLRERTVEHPLQPFGRAYFEDREDRGVHAAGAGPVTSAGALFTYAHEWRAVHEEAPADEEAVPRADSAPLPLSLEALARFLRNPVAEFMRARLQVRYPFDEEELVPEDDLEPFAAKGLVHHALLKEVLEATLAPVHAPVDDPKAEAPIGIGADAHVDTGAGTGTGPDPAALHEFPALHRAQAAVQRLQREGRLPAAALGEQVAQALVTEAQAPARAWAQRLSQWPLRQEPLRVTVPLDGAELSAWLTDLRAAGHGSAGMAWIGWNASALAEKGGKVPHLRADRLVEPWVRSLAAAAVGRPVTMILVGRDGELQLDPLTAPDAQDELQRLVQAWRAGMEAPLPVACRTAWVWLRHEADADKALAKARGAYESDAHHHGEDENPALARWYPDFDALLTGRAGGLPPAARPAAARSGAEGDDFTDWAHALYGGLSRWVAQGRVHWQAYAEGDAEAADD